MNDFFNALKEFSFVLFVGFISGILYYLKEGDKMSQNTRKEKIRFIVNAILSSMFITWLGYETFSFIGLPDNLSAALGGLLAYLGSDKVAEYFEIFVVQKLSGKKED